MSKLPLESPAEHASRREFLKSSTAAVVACGFATNLGLLPAAVHAAGSDVLRVGLIGCGGRGTGAAVQALLADPHTRLVALGDVFPDQLESSLKNLQQSDVADRVEVPADRRFVGFDAYKQVIAGVDVVLLAAPPHFRLAHLKAAIDAGRHVFAEKPVAVDAPGVRSVLAICEEAKKKNLSVVSGLCWRYETGMRETIQRIHDGQIGEIMALETTRYGGGVAKLAKRKPGWTDIEYHLRNWYYFTWLSGDFIVEQFVHELDKMAWVLKDEYPVLCNCAGGRETRTSSDYGHIFDHFNAIYEYADGTKLYAGTRHQEATSNVRLDLAHGTKGRCDLMKHRITGANPWAWGKKTTVMHQLEHNAMYRALREGQPLNNGDYMAKSTLMAIMARTSAYTGKTITWDQALNSKEDLTPPSYDWNVKLPDPPVAVPGVTRYS